MSLLPVASGARRLGVHRTTLDRWIQLGLVPNLAVRIGGRPFVRESVIHQLLTGEVAFPSDAPPPAVA
jgi:predicted site-specific integrase-resolvase